MNKPLAVGAVIVTAALVLWTFSEPPPKPSPTKPDPAPRKPVKPKPCPGPNCPADADKLRAVVGSFGASVGGPTLGDVEVSCDYPGERHRHNTASRGLGLCVFTSIHHACDWQDVSALLEFPKYLIDKGIPGGGYPSKVAQLVTKLCQERGQAEPEYLQVESNDLDVLRAACRTGRMPCVTYSHSPTGRYGGQRIAHMVNLVHLDEKLAAVLDNNYPGEDQYEWMSADEFLRTYSGGRTGWAVIFLSPGPPPAPFNAQAGFKPRAKTLPRDEPKPGGYEWRDWPEEPDWLKLFLDGRWAGVWSPRHKAYHAVKSVTTQGVEYGPKSDPPFPPPEARTAGVEWDKLAKTPRYRHGQYEVTRADALVALGVPDDAGKHRVTVVGDAATRERAARDWASPAVVEAAGPFFVLKTYDPSHWHVKSYGFGPGVTVTDAAGKELDYVASYPGGDGMAERLRRLRPDYVPGKGLAQLDYLYQYLSHLPLLQIGVLAAAVLATAYILTRRG